MAGSHPAFLSDQGYKKVAHCHLYCMSWQPNLWPVTSGTKPSKVSSGQLPCQMASQRLSATNMLMTLCTCLSPQMLRRLLTAAWLYFARPPAGNSMSASVFWFKHSPWPQPQCLPSTASASLQANKPSSIPGFSWGTTCRQRLINNSQAFIMPSAPRSGTGQLGACHFWAGCMWPSKS